MSSASDTKESMSPLYFYGRTREQDPFKRHVFSNFEPCSFKEGDLQFVCSEQYMMYQKSCIFHDMEAAAAILKETVPAKIKELGRKVKNFDEKVWEEARFRIVTKACYLKFSQNIELEKLLIQTQGYELVEASPLDRIWGIGIDRTTAEKGGREKWKGLNLLGKALMVVRTLLMEKKEEIDWSKIKEIKE